MSPAAARRRPWKPNWVTKRFIDDRGIVNLTCRLPELRHSTAIAMLSAGIPITTVSARLSHVRTSTTVKSL
jgi:site-specific recombinase XerD